MMSDWKRLPIVSVFFSSILFVVHRLKDVGGTIWIWIGLYMALQSVAMVVAAMISGLMFFGAVLGAIRWQFFRYRFTNDALEIHSGAISKLRVKIPLSRVLNVELSQPYIYRLGGFVSACFDSPGQAKKDGVIPLMKREDAIAWRNKLVSDGNYTETLGNNVNGDTNLLERSPWDLFVFGMCHNRIFILFSLLAGAYYKLSELVDNFDDRLTRYYESMAGSLPGEVVVLGWILVSLAVIAITVITSGMAEIVFRYGYRLKAVDDGLAQSEGMLTKKEQHIKLKKLQWLSIRETILDKLASRVSLRLNQLNDSMVVPAIKGAELDSLVSRIRPGISTDVKLKRVSSYGVFKAITLASLPLCYLGYLSFTVERTGFGAAFIFLAACIGLGAFARWYRFGWHFDGQKVVISTGRLDRNTHYLPLEKLQDVGISQSCLQSLLGIANVRIDVAGKSFHIKGIDEKAGWQLCRDGMGIVCAYKGHWT